MAVRQILKERRVGGQKELTKNERATEDEWDKEENRGQEG